MKMEPAEKIKKIVPTVCGICPGGCGVNVELVDGKITKISPIKGHPLGVVCVRGVHSKEIVYSDDRLKYPLRRVGEKGEGKFERITWEEAMGSIVDAFQGIKKTYGPEAVACYFGRGSFDPITIDLFGIRGATGPGTSGFLFPFGSPNASGVTSVCYVSYGLFAPLPTFGAPMNTIYPDFDNTDLVVIWGANPFTDSPPDRIGKILNARKRGVKVVVIDHLRSSMAKRANEWIGVRPGTDGALALSMIHVMIEEKLYDEDFVRQWTTGFETLAEYVRQFPPDRVEEITRVPRETIIRSARSIAAAKGASLVMYTGLEYTNSGVQNIRAVFSLWALAGHLDVPGGLVFRLPGPVKRRYANLDPPEGVKPIGADKYPFFCDLMKSAQFMEAPRAILRDDPYPLRGLLIYGSSLLTNLPNPDIWKACFKKLDFLVVYDRFLTADAMYADIVLPATTGFESLGYQRYPGGYCQLRQRVIEPVGESRSGYTFLTQLVKRLGYGDRFPATEEEYLDFVFKDSAISLEDLKTHPEGVGIDTGTETYHKYAKGLLRKDGKPGFNTPSGKVEFVSSLLQKYGYDGLPVYVEPIEGPLGSPELYKEYPLILNTGARLQSAFRSQHLNIPGLLKLHPKPLVLIHPADAEARGISDQDMVWVASPRGRVGVWARVTDDVMTGQVELNVGGGSPIQAKEWCEANANTVTDFENRDPISGFPVYKTLLCEVTKRK